MFLGNFFRYDFFYFIFFFHILLYEYIHKLLLSYTFNETHARKFLYVNFLYRYKKLQFIIREINSSKYKIIHDRCAAFKKPIEELIPSAQDFYDAVCIYVRVYICKGIYRYIPIIVRYTFIHLHHLSNAAHQTFIHVNKKKKKYN